MEPLKSGHPGRYCSMKNKSFDAVAWMRKRRVEIDEEDEGLTWEERTKKTLELLENDPLWKRLKSRVMKHASAFPRPKAMLYE